MSDRGGIALTAAAFRAAGRDAYFDTELRGWYFVTDPRAGAERVPDWTKPGHLEDVIGLVEEAGMRWGLSRPHGTKCEAYVWRSAGRWTEDSFGEDHSPAAALLLAFIMQADREVPEGWE